MDTLINSDISQVDELQRKLNETRAKLTDLATMGVLIASILDLETILSVVMEMSLRAGDAEVGLIQLESDGELTSKVSWGVDDSIVESIMYRGSENVSSYCFNSQSSVYFDKDDPNISMTGTIDSVLAVPIKSRANCHGTIVVINKSSGDQFTEDDKINMEMLANYAAVAIDNSKLMEESLTRQKMEQELTIARQVQETILPDDDKLIIDGVEIGATYCPARFIGGDIYDIINVSEQDFYMLIGDVSNKGAPAAMLMSATSALIHSEINRNPDISPAELVSNVNNVLCTGVIKSIDMFVTLFIARIDMNRMKMTYCNAGHNFPYYWDYENKAIGELSEGGTFIGQFDDATFISGARQINQGDRILAYTDGVTEAEDKAGKQFGAERLKSAFENDVELSPQQLCSKIKEWVDRFSDGAGDEAFDDFTLMELAFKRDK